MTDTSRPSRALRMVEKWVACHDPLNLLSENELETNDPKSDDFLTPCAPISLSRRDPYHNVKHVSFSSTPQIFPFHPSAAPSAHTISKFSAFPHDLDLTQADPALLAIVPQHIPLYYLSCFFPKFKVSAKALIDSGATLDCMSSRFATLHGFRLRPLKLPFHVGMPNGTSAAVTDFVSVSLQIGPLRIHRNFRIFDMTLDVVLGLPFLLQFDPDIHWRDEVMHVHHRKKSFALPLCHAQPPPPLIHSVSSSPDVPLSTTSCSCPHDNNNNFNHDVLVSSEHHNNLNNINPEVLVSSEHHNNNNNFSHFLEVCPLSSVSSEDVLICCLLDPVVTSDITFNMMDPMLLDDNSLEFDELPLSPTATSAIQPISHASADFNQLLEDFSDRFPTKLPILFHLLVL